MRNTFKSFVSVLTEMLLDYSIVSKTSFGKEKHALVRQTHVSKINSACADGNRLHRRNDSLVYLTYTIPNAPGPIWVPIVGPIPLVFTSPKSIPFF